MKRIKSIVENFGVSRPIFKVLVDDDGDISIDINEPIHKYIPTVADGDIEAELAAEFYREDFSIKHGQFVVNDHILSDIQNRVRDRVAKFILRNHPAKAPAMTKVYRWAYRDVPRTPEFDEIMFMVFKYIKSFTNDEMRVTIGNLHHANNAIALLEAMEGKYGRKQTKA